MTRRGPVIRDQRLALVLGYGGILIGALALWDAYEGRGARRPFLVKLLPGG
ncbi:hypothetical protein [Kitasatospora sp. NPDC057198]|uniref:hypothetical protein n=1 Tax=Kitasatospora sp. NPDC057198 TaxID=3346046 RepID=UPI00363ADFF0